MASATPANSAQDPPALATSERARPVRARLSPLNALLLAITIGLCGGFLDVSVIAVKKAVWNKERSFRAAADFPWTVPVAHAMLVAVPGAVVAIVNWRRPGRVALRVAICLFTTLALWNALLRAPLYAWASFVLAAGVGFRMSGWLLSARLLQRPRRRWMGVAAVVGVLAVLAAISSGRRTFHEYRTVAELPTVRAGARNVVLIVWDTVSSRALSAYGAQRKTTPNLEAWARKGTLFHRALAPAPWTFPSHATFFTGEWPFRVNSQWKYVLDTPHPTLAEFLSSQGYQTAGFVANTNSCNYETGLGRGFAHFDDYVLTPRSLFSRTVAGKWILENTLGLLDSNAKKWVTLQSRNGRDIDDAFLGWLNRRRPDRPFFAFLNYFDAHDPYIPPPGYAGRFGIRPAGRSDYQLLFDYIGMDKGRLKPRDVLMARACYDDCIAYLDEQLGRLLGQLQAQGLLENTDIIITSDHGEAFGEHGTFGHSYSVYIEETGVPLLILSPAAPAGRVVFSAVSLRDLPATVVDLLGLSAGAPFAGRSLADCWKAPPGDASELTSPALSELAHESAFQKQGEGGPGLGGFHMSLVAMGYQYIRTGIGDEALYQLSPDPFERFNLVNVPAANKLLPVFRRMLLKTLTENPGSAEVEQVYLGAYRKALAEVVAGQAPPRVTLGR